MKIAHGFLNDLKIAAVLGNVSIEITDPFNEAIGVRFLNEYMSLNQINYRERERRKSSELERERERARKEERVK